MKSYEDQIIAIVGQDNISFDSEQLGKLARRTSTEEGPRPIGIVRPANRDQVQSIVRLAAEHKISLYTISKGKNWGYGDACASVEGCLLVDLSRMNRILEVHTEFAYAVVEPGVTQGQLADYLREKKIPLIMDSTGAGPETSLIGNILDRGYGHSRYGDRFLYSCNYEVVLMDGSVISTGFGNYPNAQAQHLYKWGIGGSLDGLLTQSNFGIITRMTMWLMPRPESMEYLFLTLKTPEAITPLVDALRRLRLSGTLRSTVHLFDKGRLLAAKQRFPWDQADGKQALEVQHPELYQALCRKHGISAWAATGVLMGSHAETAAARRRIQNELKSVPGIGQLLFLNDRKMGWMRRLAGILEKWIPVLRFVNEIQMAIDLLAGIPSYATLKGGHWRARGTPDFRFDPLDSGSGLIWISPIFPASGNAICEVLQIAKSIMHQHGFEFQVACSSISERSLSGVFSVCFDKTNAEEAARARVCGEELTDALLAKGYVPYRGSPEVLARVRTKSPHYWTALMRLKLGWDPEDLLSPGRYTPAKKSWVEE